MSKLYIKLFVTMDQLIILLRETTALEAINEITNVWKRYQVVV